MVERKQALLRDQLHKIDTQLRAEELGVPFKYKLASNCLLMALYGKRRTHCFRCPFQRLLPMRAQ
eukprot:11203736-Lingulodinium_polyedra.AAC.1